MDAQRKHDKAMASRAPGEPGSKQRVEALLKKKKSASSPRRQPTAFDPLASAVSQNPGLTREEAEEMARAFGF